MNELINQASISSQQIADMVNKRHDSVRRTIDFLVKATAIQVPHHAEVKNHLGQGVLNYVFAGEQGRLDSITVVAQLSPTFTTALVKRWDELERGLVVAPQIPQSFAEALQLAADQAKQLEIAAPKVAAFDKLLSTENLMTVSDVSKKMGMSPQALNKKMITLGVYDQRRVGKKIFNQWFIEDGLGEMKTTDEGYSRNLVTAKGQAWAFDLFGGNEQ